MSHSDQTLLSHTPFRGKTVIITGATGGLGFEAARAFAHKGAKVILSGRSEEKGRNALLTLQRELPKATLRYETLNLASMASVTRCVERLRSEPIHMLINNAGVMAPRKRLTTEDGFELQFGTNYLGHYALCGLMLPQLLASEATILNVASLAALKGTLDFDNLNAEKTYQRYKQYQSSKLASLIFSLELARRTQQAGAKLNIRAVHPGWSRTQIFENSRSPHPRSFWAELIARGEIAAGKALFSLFGQTAERGADSLLYAALVSDTLQGAYFGPQKWGERCGPPGPAKVPPCAKDLSLSAKLWQCSEDLTKVIYNWAPSLSP